MHGNTLQRAAQVLGQAMNEAPVALVGEEKVFEVPADKVTPELRERLEEMGVKFTVVSRKNMRKRKALQKRQRRAALKKLGLREPPEPRVFAEAPPPPEEVKRRRNAAKRERRKRRR